MARDMAWGKVEGELWETKRASVVEDMMFGKRERSPKGKAVAGRLGRAK